MDYRDLVARPRATLEQAYAELGLVGEGHEVGANPAARLEVEHHPLGRRGRRTMPAREQQQRVARAIALLQAQID